MKLKKSNIVLICLTVVFFINIAINFIITNKQIKGIIQSKKNNIELSQPN